MHYLQQVAASEGSKCSTRVGANDDNASVKIPRRLVELMASLRYCKVLAKESQQFVR